MTDKILEPIRLSADFVLLCEGDADRYFFQTLLKNRGLPDFDIPYLGHGGSKFSGNSAFSEMLRGLRGDMASFSRTKAVLIVADSGSEPDQIFESIRCQVGRAGFPMPSRLSEMIKAPGYPAVKITLLPSDNVPGALESLYAEEIQMRNPGVEECVDAFLRCGPIRAFEWPIEKKDKARYECMVAGLNRSDPSRAASRALFGTHPVVQIGSNVFDDIAHRIQSFCEEARAYHAT